MQRIRDLPFLTQFLTPPLPPPRPRRGLRRLAAVALAGVVLAACGGRSDGPPAPLHLACQTVECECRTPRESVFTKRTTTDIVWKQNGDATCPDGYVLERVELDFLGRRR